VKTPSEIVGFIDDLQRHMLQRPSMYASSPESLEEQFGLLESLRAFIMSDQPGFPTNSGYREYAMQVGKCGAMSFTGKRRQDIWEDFCKFFRGYLKSQGRVKEKRSDWKSRRRRAED
jgi:hypothetical protein